jgi:hypothetical protein
MKQGMRRLDKRVLILPVVAGMLSGCGGMVQTTPVTSADGSSTITGTVHGGQQPVAGATILLYAAATSGYGVAAKSLLTAPVVTKSDGTFSVTGDYSCTAGQQLYFVAKDGNPGGGVNPNLSLMAAVGDCSSVGRSTSVEINEVTTVASVFALAPFMSSYAAVGTSPGNTTGLAHAFASVNKLANTTLGTSPGTALPSGATAPVATVNTLANIAASCVNSTGGSADDGSACGSLFEDATPFGTTAPTDVVQALLDIAKNPATNVVALFGDVAATAPFGPTLQTAPNDWTLAVTYTPPGLDGPASTTVDGAGNVWITSTDNNSVVVLQQTGVPATFSPLSGNGLSYPTGVAIDAAGSAWVANSGGMNVSVFTASGGVFGSSPFTGNTTISNPASLAIDAQGNVWVANTGNDSVTELDSSGTYVQQITSGIVQPSAIAIAPQ